MNSIKSSISIILALLSFISVFGQSSVSGRVLTTEYQPIPFANVISSIDQSAADVNGNYKINISSSDTQ